MNKPKIRIFNTSLKIKKRASNSARGHQIPLYMEFTNYGVNPTPDKENYTYLDTLRHLRKCAR
jgi:hypothetical protein